MPRNWTRAVAAPRHETSQVALRIAIPVNGNTYYMRCNTYFVSPDRQALMAGDCLHGQVDRRAEEEPVCNRAHAKGRPGARVDAVNDPASEPRRPSGGEGRASIVVLLVDDQRSVCMAVARLLDTESDIELHCCEAAVDAIAFANRLAPTVILQDLFMPDVDGLTLIRSFRENPGTSATPIIALSGNDDAASRARALVAGAADCVIKLPRKADLVACIRHHAGGGPESPAAIDPRAIATLDEAASPDFTRRVIAQLSAQVEDQISAVPADPVAPGLIREIEQELVRVRDALATGQTDGGRP
jgi:CheY-like chemotaxis protein